MLSHTFQQCGARRVYAKRLQASLSTSSVRACGSWRPGRRPGDEPDTKHEGSSQQQSGQSNMRESMWRQRVDVMRRALDEDFQQTLLGKTNRLRRFSREGSWPYNLFEKDWDSAQSVINQYWGRAQAFSKNLDSKLADAIRESECISEQSSTKSTNESLSSTSGQNEDSPLEYDPISNRMVRKGDKVFSHYGQDLDAAVEIPVKPYRPSTKASEPSSPSPKTLPTFTMLKEEPAESQPAPKETATNRDLKASIREEYNRYKAQRLPPTFAPEDWLEREGFGTKPRQTQPSDKTVDQSAQPEKKIDRRAKLEQKFEQAYSPEKERVEESLVDKNKPWKVQRSKGTIVPEFQSMPSELQAMMEIHAYNSQVAKDNTRVAREQREVDRRHEMQALEQIGLARASAEAIKEQESSNAVSGAATETSKVGSTSPMDTNTMIASMQGYLGQPMNDRGEVPVPTKMDIKTIETSLQRHSINAAKAARAVNVLRTSIERRNKRIPETGQSLLREPVEEISKSSRTHDPVGYDHGRESVDAREPVSNVPSPNWQRSPTWPPEELAKSNRLNNLLVIKERHMDKSITRIDDMERRGGFKPDSEEKAAMIPVKEKSLTERREEEKRAMLAEVESWSRKMQPVMDESKKIIEKFHTERKRIFDEKMNKEVKEQKAAMRVAEEIRSRSPARSAIIEEVSTSEPVKAEQVQITEDRKDSAAELVREIRNIYESKYGQITTKHRQDETTAPEPIIVDISARAPEIVEEDKTSSNSGSPPEAKPTGESKQQTVTYKILAFDPQTQTVTMATLPAIPASENENPIPLTVALRELEHPAKFLPYVQKLRETGFTSVFADKDLLMLRQSTPLPAVESIASEVHESAEPLPIRKYFDIPESDSPRPKRLETVFSGKQGRQRKYTPWKSQTKTVKDWDREFAEYDVREFNRRGVERRERRREWRRKFRRNVRRALVLGGIGVGTLYIAGVMAEMKKVVVVDGEGKKG